MVKQCHYCGRYFVPDKRVGARQKSCGRAECRQKRKKQAQRQWCDKNPGYFKGDYWRIKQWRQQKKQSRESSPEPKDNTSRMIQDKIPPSKPYQQLVLLIPETLTGVIQDEIRLRRVDGSTFAAYG